MQELGGRQFGRQYYNMRLAPVEVRKAAAVLRGVAPGGLRRSMVQITKGLMGQERLRRPQHMTVTGNVLRHDGSNGRTGTGRTGNEVSHESMQGVGLGNSGYKRSTGILRRTWVAHLWRCWLRGSSAVSGQVVANGRRLAPPSKFLPAVQRCRQRTHEAATHASLHDSTVTHVLTCSLSPRAPNDISIPSPVRLTMR